VPGILEALVDPDDLPVPRTALCGCVVAFSGVRSFILDLDGGVQRVEQLHDLRAFYRLAEWGRLDGLDA
jgi:hypothetical protein